MSEQRLTGWHLLHIHDMPVHMSEKPQLLKYYVDTGQPNAARREVEAHGHKILSNGKELHLYKNGKIVFVIHGFMSFQAEPVKQDSETP